MNNNFEQRLQRQPLRTVPANWRAEILTAANSAPHPSPSTSCPESSITHPASWWRELLWPNPLAWGGLAAVWALILALNVFAGDKSQATAKQSPPPSPEVIMVLKEQRRELAQLIGLDAPKEATEPKSFLPRPRSERQDGMMTT